MKYDIHCEECGKFCRPADSGVYYGGCLDLEPPDPTFFCQSCVDKFLDNPEHVIVGCWWIKPNYVRAVESYKSNKNI